MTPEERAAGSTTADLGEWPETPPDDTADLVSADLRYAATFLGAAVLIIAAGVAIVAVLS